MNKWRNIPWQERVWTVYGIVRQLQPHAYGATIQREIEQQFDHSISASRLFTHLDRLVQQGFLRRESQPHPTMEDVQRSSFLPPANHVRFHKSNMTICQGWPKLDGFGMIR